MLKIGVIGTGSSGKNHLDKWKLIPGTEIVGFYEPDDDIANEVSEKCQLPRFLHANILIDTCDAIDITAPVMSHFEWCEMAVKNGKHVIVASPLAHTLNETRQLVKLVKESGIKFHIECTERFNPALLAINDMLLNPLFIEIHQLIRFDNESAEKNMVLDVMIHDIDLILSIVKSDVKTIAATSVAVITDDPDTVNIRLEFHNGCIANLTSSRVAMKNKKKMSLFQKDLCMDIDLLNKKTEIIKLKQRGDSDVFAFDTETTSGRITVITDHLFVPEVNELKTELEEFQHTILNNTKPVISEIEGLIAMEVAHQVLGKISKHIIAR